MKHIFKVLVFILMITHLHSQQIVMFNHYFYKPMVYNPAYTGNSDAPNLMLINHTQWTGFKGGPQYNLLTFDGNLINKNTGLGITIVSDKKGVNSRVGGNVSYSYKLKFKDKIYLLLGLSIGVINQSIDYSKAIIENPNDPSLFTNSQNKTTFDANAGLAFVCKGLEFGFSAPQIANNKINYVSNSDIGAFYTQSRHYMTSLKYKFLVSKAKEITITPLALIRYVPNTPTQYDANVNLDWQNKFWIGATYKSNYAIGLNLGVVLFKRFSIGYSYDYITGSINKYSGLSHEIMLNFKFIKPKKEILSTDQAEDEELKRLASQDLNKLIIQRLLEKIEALLDKEKTTPEEIQALLDEISSFFDSESVDPMQETLNRYYKSLKKQAQGEINVLVKGKIAFEGDEQNTDYSKVNITITDLETNKIIATCKPTLKDGKYYIILKPAKKYQIVAENDGYQKYSKNLSLAGTPESYEMNLEIRFKK
jgi:type IX secretion system PorP/SprF family membrane protein